jgi:hypothetical protein
MSHDVEGPQRRFIAVAGPIRNREPLWWRVIGEAGNVAFDFLDVDAALNVAHHQTYKRCPCRECAPC